MRVATLAPPSAHAAPDQREEEAVADRDEPPFEGGSQPVKQMPPTIPPSRPSPLPWIMGIVVVLLLVSGLVFIFAH